VTGADNNQESPAQQPGFLFPGSEETRTSEPLPVEPDERPAAPVRHGLSLRFVLSVALHAIFFTLLFFNLPSPKLEQPPEETVTVDMVPPPEEKKPEPKPEAPKPPEAKVEKAARAPDATMLAVPPPPPRKDIPESDRFAGAAKPDKPESPVETAPKPDETAKPAEDNRPAPGEDTPRPPDEAKAEAPANPSKDDPAKAARDAADILAAKEGSGVSAPDNPPVPPPQTPSADPAPKPTPPGQGVKDAPPLKRAKVLSNARLNDPLQRMALGQLPLKKRIVQLCTFEALAQVMQARPGTQLHGMVPYADHQDRIEGGVLNATGGAYRTMAGDWYDISFRCAVNADDMTVTSFSFHLGDKKVTRAERKARGLPTD